MNLSKSDTHLLVQRDDLTTDDSGGIKHNWKTIGTAWGRKIDPYGYVFRELAARNGGLTVAFEVRYSPLFNIKTRIIWENHPYDIVYASERDRTGMQTLACRAIAFENR